jgi:hypothetical protein
LHGRWRRIRVEIDRGDQGIALGFEAMIGRREGTDFGDRRADRGDYDEHKHAGISRTSTVMAGHCTSPLARGYA